MVDIIDAVCREYQADKAVLLWAGKARQGAEMRAMTSMIVQDMEGLTLTSLAGELGRDLSALSKAAGRLRMRMATDVQLQMKAEKRQQVSYVNKVE